MNPSTRLTSLRYGLATAFARRIASDGCATPGLHHLLTVPLRERLVLLAKIDGADPRTIRSIMLISREDADCTSPEMLTAIKIWQRSLENAYWNLPEKHGWRKQRNVLVERSLSQLLWADVAVALIGDGTLPEINTLPLLRRLILYLLLVEQADWATTRRLIRCSNWDIRQSVIDALRAVGQLSPSQPVQ